MGPFGSPGAGARTRRDQRAEFIRNVVPIPLSSTGPNLAIRRERAGPGSTAVKGSGTGIRDRGRPINWAGRP